MRKFDISSDFKDKGRPTICDTLRRLWARAEAAGDETSMELVADAFDYAKRMDARLRWYKFGGGAPAPSPSGGNSTNKVSENGNAG